MSEDTTGRAQTTESGAAGGDKTNQEGGDSVSYQTHRRLLSEKKELQTKTQELQARLEALEQEKMAVEGNKDQLIESLKKQTKEASEKATRLANFFKFQVVSDKVERKAIEAGCVDPKTFVKNIDLTGIEPDIDNGFAVDEQAIQVAVENGKKNLPYFFTQPKPKINDVVPRTINGIPDKKPSEMSTEELLRALKETR